MASNNTPRYLWNTLNCFNVPFSKVKMRWGLETMSARNCDATFAQDLTCLLFVSHLEPACDIASIRIRSTNNVPFDALGMVQAKIVQLPITNTSSQWHRGYGLIWFNLG